ncbi:MAG: type II secretion system protein GspL [Gammaproteobacteria bacterium]|nr:type II secretion system protein GspL [Gammaproteobacteria bacterium]MCW9029907.1 type II secretion system protein GspL [Gammaproteobacteria bacterium]
MNSNFYLFIPAHVDQNSELESVDLSWVYEDINNDLKVAQGSLNNAAAAALNHKVSVIIPGENILFLTADVPGKNLQHIQQAVPYILEDSVIDDVDDLHFALIKATDGKAGNSDTANEYNVAVINKGYFESIISQLEKCGIHADEMIADYALLEKNTLLLYGGRVLFNSYNLKFSALIENDINLDNYGLTENNMDKLIYCNTEADLDKKIDELSAELNVKKEQCNTDPLLYLISHKSEEKNINLLQGLYKKKKNWSKTGKTWLPVAVLFVVWLSVQGFMFITDYIWLNNQNKILETKITQIYKNAFPSAKRTDNPKARMESQLISLKKRKGQSGRSFSEMLASSAEIFSKTQGLKIKSLRYYDGRINLELDIASLQALDKLKSQLIKDKGYLVEIQNASSEKESVTARVQITGATL